MPALNAAQIFERLGTRFGADVHDFTAAVADPRQEGPRDAFCRVAPARVAEVCRFLKEDPDLGMDFLAALTAVDWPARGEGGCIEVVYHLYSYRHRHAFVLKAAVPRAQPALPSVSGVWAAADWNEREMFDLFGVIFEGHPDLRRLLLPDDWEGHPLRKDWKEAPHYRSMPTTRPSPLDLLAADDRAHAAPPGGGGGGAGGQQA